MPNLTTPRRAMPLLVLALAGLTSACAPGELRELTSGARDLASAASEIIAASNGGRSRDRSYAQPSSYNYNYYRVQAPAPRYGSGYGRRF